MKLTAKVNNLPNEVDEKYVVARIDGIELWFWGSYETRRRAEEVAYELGRAIVLEADAEIETYINCCEDVKKRYPNDRELINQAEITAYERIVEAVKGGE